MNHSLDPSASPALAEKLFHVNLTSEQIARFWSKVDIKAPDECWIWKGAISGKRYGAVKINYIDLRAHRVSFFIAHGSFDDSLLVCHKCDVTKCVNPAHLFLGNNTVNVRDMASKARGKTKARMTIETADEIRRVYAAGGITQQKVADKFGISIAMVCFIINRKFWK